MKVRVYILLLFSGLALSVCLVSCVSDHTPAATVEEERTVAVLVIPEEPSAPTDVTEPSGSPDRGPAPDGGEESETQYRETDSTPDKETQGGVSSEAPDDSRTPCESTVPSAPSVPDDSPAPDDPSQGEWDSQK
jgi:hypothetical protein